MRISIPRIQGLHLRTAFSQCQECPIALGRPVGASLREARNVCTRLVLPIGPCHQTRLEKENARPVTFDAKRGCVPARVGDVDRLSRALVKDT